MVMIIWKDYMPFLKFCMFFLSKDCPFCCKVQIILCFKFRLHIQYIVHGFYSIIHWLLFTLFCHSSFHRKKIHYPLYQHWWMFSGLYEMGRTREGGGVKWTTVQISVDATLSGSGVERKKSLKHTHALRLHIDCIVSCMYEPCHTELTSRFKQTPKIRELIFTFS